MIKLVDTGKDKLYDFFISRKKFHYHESDQIGSSPNVNPKTFTTAPNNRDDNGMERGQLLYHLIIFIE